MAWKYLCLVFVALTTSSAYIHHQAAHREKYQKGKAHITIEYDVEYPNLQESRHTGSNQFIPKISLECEKLGVCESTSNYPHEYVDTLLTKIADRTSMLDQELPGGVISFHLDEEIPNMKLNQSFELCQPDVKIIYPQAIKTNAGNWVFVLNGKDNKVQGFVGTLCRNPGYQCDHTVTFPDHCRTKCQQEYINQSMWGLDYSGNMKFVVGRIASCCKCMLQC
ncbi:uncharacterized protein LOC114352353 [Ostrinia furnacalis]|uniref:uncharacterized protein LOC114352353 n=1 Tax=Ostrinia furnacalis TaxID=93504 RepID=UPI00103AF971|nr:uncharacterized protein LOC114352353 [Ostrinia furnacalis]